MKLKFEKVLEDFYKEYKDTELKGFTYVQVSNIVKTPFRYLKQNIKEGWLHDLRFIGLGVFRIREWQVRRKLESYNEICKNVEIDSKGEERPLIVQKYLIGVRDRLKDFVNKIDKENEN